MTTGQLIKSARKKAGMTQKQLAEKLGISYVNISQLENGQRIPKYETVCSIAAALDVEWTELVTEDIQGQMVINHMIGKMKGTPKSPKTDMKFTVSEDVLRSTVNIAENQLRHQEKLRVSNAIAQMSKEGICRVADYAEDILPRYRATPPPQPAVTSTDGEEDTTPPEPPPESPEDGK